MIIINLTTANRTCPRPACYQRLNGLPHFREGQSRSFFYKKNFWIDPPGSAEGHSSADSMLDVDMSDLPSSG